MTIPLDRLYHYIANLTQNIFKDNIIIYRFYPHGSKNIKDQQVLQNCNTLEWVTKPQLYCYDQEPLNYSLYENVVTISKKLQKILKKYNININQNIRVGTENIYDQCLLLHSEKNSQEVIKYANNNFIPVYYWSHALLARDWFRYAEIYIPQKNKIKKKFLIYNRAWSNTREYRLKFIELLIKNDLFKDCLTHCNVTDPETNLHYSNYKFINKKFIPETNLNNYAISTEAPSSSSADFNEDDYNSTEIEIVLETLFDDQRNHLTEKILRPIALGQPFVLVATPNSLKYLKSYGFKTFDQIWDEEYDTINDPIERLQKIIETMETINKWNEETKIKNHSRIQEIVDYNKSYFFSKDFFNLITDELKTNLKSALDEVVQLNTSEKYISWRKKIQKYPEIKEYLNTSIGFHSREEIAKAIRSARAYYNKYLHDQKNIN